MFDSEYGFMQELCFFFFLYILLIILRIAVCPCRFNLIGFNSSEATNNQIHNDILIKNNNN